MTFIYHNFVKNKKNMFRYSHKRILSQQAQYFRKRFAGVTNNTRWKTKKDSIFIRQNTATKLCKLETKQAGFSVVYFSASSYL